ncbi:DUF4179 domain-containing protein [Paenibacillus sp. N1-5-1-14]|uniref:DUF4179 domain-containing protein n=1 Tax=Paenibacillus radicibacter TaxID=2972488 RepID=UPI0021598B69|nr:DUF4179 domain-containing protein [Paenibacillus radicibacter]MCR8643293.1 DUF4179 domain-containing protein [Paenibacillus radicibacter]
MREKVHSFKQEMDKIPVPLDKLDAIIHQTVYETKIMRQVPKRRKLWVGVGAAAMAVVVLLGSTAVSPVMASMVSRIPLVGSIFSEFGDLGLQRASQQGLTYAVGEPQQVDGTSITVDEVFYDGTRLSIGYSVQSDQPIEELYLRPSLLVNGKSSGFGGGQKDIPITSTSRTSILDINMNQTFPEQFELGLSLETESGKSWNFTIPVQAQSNVKLIPVDEKQQAGDINLHVVSLKMGQAGALLNFSAVSGDKNHLASYLEFKVVDESGREITSHSGGSEGKAVKGKEYVTGSRLFDPIDSSVKTLTITPYFMLPTNGGGVAMDKDGKETVLEFTPPKADGIAFKSFTITLP